MEDIVHKKNIVVQERMEKLRQHELTKITRALGTALKEVSKRVKVIDKDKEN